MDSHNNSTDAFPQGEGGLATGTLPVPAPLSLRTLAFVADSLLVVLLCFLFLKILLPIFCSNELAILFDYYREIFSLSNAAVEATAHGGSPEQFTEAINALSVRAGQDESLFSLFETAMGISFAVALLYFLLMEYFMRGRTLGKKIFGIRTVFVGTMVAPTFLQTLSRSFWKALTVVPAGVLIALVVIINAHVVVFARRHRGWHDKLTRTEVVVAQPE